METTKIDGLNYILHSTKADGKDIGKVPVPQMNTLADIQTVASETGLNESMICKAAHQGLAIALQRMARQLATKGHKMTQSEYNKIWSSLDKETLIEYHGNKDGLDKHIQAIWQEQNPNGDEYGPDYVWEELV